MFSTRPEGVATVSNATEPTTRMLMSLQAVVSRWSLVVSKPERGEHAMLCKTARTTNDQRLPQVLPHDQLQLFFRRRRNFFSFRQNGMCQCRSALARTGSRQAGDSRLHNFGGVLRISDQDRNDLVYRHR